MNEFIINTEVVLPEVNVSTYPQGPRGVGIKSISQNGNIITVTFDDDSQQNITFPDWWFGTAEAYYSMSEAEKKKHFIHFIEE